MVKMTYREKYELYEQAIDNRIKKGMRVPVVWIQTRNSLKLHLS